MIEGTPSRTALVVAKSVALMGALDGGKVEVDPAGNREGEIFAREALKVCGQDGFLRWLDSAIGRRLIRAYERVMIPGLARHQVLRKSFLERQVTVALESGSRRVVQIGAGLDSLCWRLHRKWKGVEFVEVDHPSTQGRKREVLERFPWEGNLVLRPANLAEERPGGLEGDIVGERTILVVEGVLMYLSPESVKRWFRCWSSVVAPASRLLFTFMEDSRFRRQHPLVEWWLRRAGEPFRWHASREQVESLLRETGWRIDALHATWRGAESGEVAAGEWIAVAIRA